MKRLNLIVNVKYTNKRKQEWSFEKLNIDTFVFTEVDTDLLK